jgi:hypothetical protein
MTDEPEAAADEPPEQQGILAEDVSVLRQRVQKRLAANAPPAREGSDAVKALAPAPRSAVERPGP